MCGAKRQERAHNPAIDNPPVQVQSPVVAALAGIGL
jgi:hypothetical protein